MTYTKQIREYCLKHKGQIIEVSKLSKEKFPDIPYKTLLKIFNRLEEEQVAVYVGKGLYRTGEKDLTYKELIDKFIGNKSGMIVGYSLYRKIGLSLYLNDEIEIYSNVLSTKKKKIGKLVIKGADLVFDNSTKDLITLLEILKSGFEIQMLDLMAYSSTLDMLSVAYKDEVFTKVVEKIKYPASAIMRLDELLKRNKIDNHCLAIFEKCANIENNGVVII